MCKNDKPAERITEINERLTLAEKPGGQCFGADAYLLSAFVGSTGGIAVDFGGGTGICSMLLADRKKASRIFSVEIQSELHCLALKNIQNNRLTDIITPICADIRTLDSSVFGGAVDTVLSNPPYFTVGSGVPCPDESKRLSRFEHNGSLSDFCAAAARILKPCGSFFSVIRPERLSDLMLSLKASGLEPKSMVLVSHNQTAVPSMLLTEAVKGATPQLKVRRPLFLYGDDGKRTPDTMKIYENCSFEDFFR